MSGVESVTEWLHQLKNGEQDAAHQLWSRYVERLVRLATRKLKNSPRGAADEEDAVIEAFTAFMAGVEAGRFQELEDRDDLWKILVMLTDRRANDLLRSQLAKKRGGGNVRGGSAFAHPSSGVAAAEFLDAQPTPAFAAETQDQLEVLLGKLDDGQLRRIAILKMSGNSNQEIAEQLSKSISSVERKLRLIREIWRESEPNATGSPTG